MNESPQKATDFVLAQAAALGFARAGVTGTERPERYPAYEAWLERGDHGTMSYMADDFHRLARADMSALLPEVRSAIVVALAYDKRESSTLEDGTARGRVAQYALGDDYHHVIKRKLSELSKCLGDFIGAPIQSRACVDSVPLLERELAARAGLGFVAKNTMLISPGLGSYTLLGVLLTDVQLAPTDDSSTKDCGSCTACLDACPTGAFPTPFKLDAKLCISYLTIESAEAIPVELRPAVGEKIFGCDICQDVCPYNAAAPLRHSSVPELKPRDGERAQPRLSMLAALGSNQRKRYLTGTAMRRNNRTQMLRNVAVALGNQPGISEQDRMTLDELSEDKSALVREHARWALRKISQSQ